MKNRAHNNNGQEKSRKIREGIPSVRDDRKNVASICIDVLKVGKSSP